MVAIFMMDYAPDIATSMRGTIVAALLIFAILVGAGVGYLVGASDVRIATSVSTLTAPTVSTTTTVSATTTLTSSAPSLELLARVSPPTIARGQNISIVAEVYNPLPVSVTINASRVNSPTQAPCGLGASPSGFQVYLGRYTFANLTAAMPVYLYNASGPPPPCPFFSPNVYTFQPNSDEARLLVGYGGNLTIGTAFETKTFSGYWTNCGNFYPFKCSFQKFSSGIYSVLAFDAWGQQAIEYFEVA